MTTALIGLAAVCVFAGLLGWALIYKSKKYYHDENNGQ